MSNELKKFRAEMRKAVADYMRSEGCSCCQSDNHDLHLERLAKLLNVPAYPDKSGYDFPKFRTPNQD